VVFRDRRECHIVVSLMCRYAAGLTSLTRCSKS
jgi:hypothetical protein